MSITYRKHTARYGTYPKISRSAAHRNSVGDLERVSEMCCTTHNWGAEGMPYRTRGTPKQQTAAPHEFLRHERNS